MKNTILVGALLLSVGTLFGAVKNVNYSLSEDCSLVKPAETIVSGWRTLAVPGFTPAMNEPGVPMLPYKEVTVAIPVGASVTKVSASSDWALIDEDIMLAPVQEILPGSTTNAPLTEPNAESYTKVWPEGDGLINDGESVMSGIRLLHLRIIPFRYDAKARRLEGATRFEVTVEMDVPAMSMFQVGSGYARELIDRVRKQVVNPNDVSLSRGGITLKSVDNSSPQPDYILIAPPKYITEWTAYVTARQSDHPEVTMACANLSDILTAYPVNTDDSTLGYYARNDAERLHAYIRAQATAGTHYFVLAGPWYDATGRKTLSWSDGTIMGPNNAIPGIPSSANGGTSYIPSDLFYACTDIRSGKYPWDPNGDSYYCNDAQETTDLDPDVAVSRISFKLDGSDNLTMANYVNGYLAKVRKVESATYDGRSRYAASVEVSGGSWARSHAMTVREETEWHTGSYNAFDRTHPDQWADMEPWASFIIKKRLGRFGASLGGMIASDTDWARGYASQAATISAIQSQDWEYVFCSAHGAMGGTAGFYTGTSRTQTGLTKIFAANDPCLTGYPDWQKDGNGTRSFPCNSECLIENTTGGATFVVANSREGFFINNLVKLRDLDTGDGYSCWLANLFSKGIAELRMKTGDAWLYMEQNFGNRIWRGQLRWAWAEQMAYGDPFIASTALPNQTWADGFASVVGGTNTVNASGSTTLALDSLHTALALEVNQNDGDTLTLSGNGGLRVTQGMKVSGGNVKIATGGGAAYNGLVFTGSTRGNVTFSGSQRFYLEQLVNAGTVTLAGSNALLDIRKTDSGTTHDFTTLAFSGDTIATRSGNVIRSDLAGALNDYLPLTLNGFDLSLETARSQEGATAEKFADLTSSKLTVSTNPLYASGETDEWEEFSLPIVLNSSEIVVDTPKLRLKDGFQLDVYGTGNRLSAKSGGYFTLDGTTTIVLHDGADLTLSGEMRNGTDGGVVIEGNGTVTVANVSALAGSVEIKSSVGVTLSKLPLQNVSTLVVKDGATMTLPTSTSGTYQLLPSIGSHLEVENPTSCFGSEVEVLESGLVFDSAKVLSWNATNGIWTSDTTETPWLSGGVAAAYNSTKSTLFPKLTGEAVSITVNGAMSAPSAAFINENTPYTLSAANDSSSLTFGSLNAGGKVDFEVPVTVSGSAQIMGGTSDFKGDGDLALNALDVMVYGGATLGAESLGHTVSKISHIRIIFLGQKNLTDYPGIRVDEFVVNGSRVYGSVAGYTGGGVTYSNLGAMIDGNSGTTQEYVDATTGQTVINATAAQLSAGQAYVTITLSSAIDMFSTYGFHLRQMIPSRSTSVTDALGHAPSHWQIQVSSDGLNYMTVANQYCGYYDLWLGGSSTAFSASATSSRATAEVLAEGTLSTYGTYDAVITLEADSCLKAVSGKSLTLASGASLVLPDDGKVSVDTSALTLSSTPAAILTNAGLTIKDLSKFKVLDTYAELRVLNGGLYAVIGNGLTGPYTRTLSGDVVWNSSDWYYDSGTPTAFPDAWGDLATSWDAEVQLDLASDSTLTVDTEVILSRLSACTTNNIVDHALTIVGATGGSLNVGTLDLRGFNGKVEFDIDTGAADVIAGVDTVLDYSGTGTLTIGEGMQATLKSPWSGTVEGTGTLVYAFDDPTTETTRPTFDGTFRLESGTIKSTATNDKWTLAGVQIELGENGTVEIAHSANSWQRNLDYSGLTGIGTVYYPADTNNYYVGFPKNDGTSWYGSDTLSFKSDAIMAVQCMGNVTRNFRNLEGAAQFRFDASGSATSGTMTFRTTQTKMTEWSGYLWPTSNNRSGALTVAGLGDKPDRKASLTISATVASTTGNASKLTIEENGYVILNGAWNGTIVNNGVLEIPPEATEPTWTGTGKVVRTGETVKHSIILIYR